jgi:hypothetical protein
MVISDEKVEEVLSTITSLMQQMKEVTTQNGDLQKRNSDLHIEMIQMLKSTARHQQWIPEGHNQHGESGDMQEGRRLSNGPFPNPTPHSNTPKPVRPIIEEGVDDFGWKLFLDKWSRFKIMTRLQDQAEICMNLRESCSPEIDRLLFQYVGEESLNRSDLTEEELLENVKSVAVRSIHTEVHRWHFNQLEQHDSEPATKFVGRLKAQAALCNFKVECKCGESVSYDEEMVSQRLTSGIQNPEHQRKVLGEAEKLDTLKKKVDKLISLETTDDATDKIRAPAPTRATPARATQYKKNQRQAVASSYQKSRPTERRFPTAGEGRPTERRFPTAGERRRCRGCGRHSHGEGKSFERKDCPAFGKKCNTCQKENHFSKVCMKRKTRASYARSGDECDTSGSESDSEQEYTTCTEDSADEGAFHYAVQAEDFCLCHPPGRLR